MADSVYTRPYIESGVFISWIKGAADASPTVDRGGISRHVLKQAENGEFPIITSYLSIAEVFKKRGDGQQRLTDEENGRILKYFESDFIIFVELDRSIAEEANRLCRQYRANHLMPNDAIHLASALRAQCDVLLTWDKDLVSVPYPGIRIENPRILGQQKFDDLIGSV